MNFIDCCFNDLRTYFDNYVWMIASSRDAVGALRLKCSLAVYNGMVDLQNYRGGKKGMISIHRKSW